MNAAWVGQFLADFVERGLGVLDGRSGVGLRVGDGRFARRAGLVLALGDVGTCADWAGRQASFEMRILGWGDVSADAGLG